MKKFTFLSLLLLAGTLSASSQNYFEIGTVWNTEVSSTEGPYPEWTPRTFSIDENTVVDGDDALVLSVTDNEEPKRDLTVIKSEGEKIYYKNNKNSAEWTLLYDFGLEAGECCTVGVVNFWWENNDEPLMCYLKCTAVNESDPLYSDYPTLYMEEYADSDYQVKLGTGVWIKGIGGSTGVTGNARFESDGSASRLISVDIQNNVKVYPKDPSGLQDIMDGDRLGSDGVSASGAIYDLYGRKVDQMHTGSIYIMDGKKVIGR